MLTLCTQPCPHNESSSRRTPLATLPSDLLGLCGAADDLSQHGGSAAKDQLAAVAAAKEAASPGLPPPKRVRLELPANLAAAAAAAVASGDYGQLTAAAAAAAGTQDCGCLPPALGLGRPSSVERMGSLNNLQRLAGQAAVPALSASRLERELEKALRAFIRIR